MKSLLEQCEELRGKVDRIANREADVQVANSLLAVSEVVTGHLQRAQSMQVHLHIMISNKVIMGEQIASTAQIASLQKRIDAVKKRLKEKRANLKQGNTWANCDEELTKLIKSAESGLAIAWRAFLAQHHTDTSNFTTFRRVTACAVPLKKVDAINQAIQAKIATLPDKDKDVAEIIADAEKAREVIMKLKLGNIPAAVQIFLKNAAGSGASLADLSDDVLEWLRENPDYLSGLRVSASLQ